MAWWNPFRRRDGNTITCWGYSFQLTDDHFSKEDLKNPKFSYDKLGEECLNILDEIDLPSKPELATPKTEEQKSEKSRTLKPKRDLFKSLQTHVDDHPKLQELWSQLNTVPEWVDWDQISRGQEIFYRYGGATLTSLAYQSLLGGMGANRVVEVLARTGGFSVKVARHRLFETTQHILECTKSLESIQPGGAGFASSIRVRLLHAAVRQRIMKLEQSRPGYYNVEKYGVPINDLDCIATINTFSASIIWLGLPRQGLFLRSREIEDYLALWRLIAYYTGTPTEPFETPKRAKVMMESLLMNEIDPSETSKVLAGNVIKSLEDQPPAYTSRSFLEVNARWLNGNELCDALGLGKPSFYYWALMAGQCLFFMALCYTYRSFRWLDRRKIAALRKIFWIVIVEGKHGLGEETVFEFKYVPDFHVTTEAGAERQVGIKERRAVERRNLQVLLIGLTCTGGVIYGCLKVASSIYQHLPSFSSFR